MSGDSVVSGGLTLAGLAEFGALAILLFEGKASTVVDLLGVTMLAVGLFLLAARSGWGLVVLFIGIAVFTAGYCDLGPVGTCGWG